MTENILTVIKDKVIAKPQPELPAPSGISTAVKLGCAAAVFTALATACTFLAEKMEDNQ